MRRLSRNASGLTKDEYAVLDALRTPAAIQDFLDALPMNWEKDGPTYRSPRGVLAERKAHCIEGALLAATALWIHGEPPVVMDLSAVEGKGDTDHVIALYRRAGHWGAVSKTNHAVLRFRDPVYHSPRELALSYFNEWFLPTGEKTLECYGKPLHLTRFGTGWITAPDAQAIVDAVSIGVHYDLVPKGGWRHVRSADSMERKAASSLEWPRSDPRT